MSWLQKMKTLNTACSVQATGKLFNLPWSASKETTQTQVFDKSRRLAEIDWDRIILFKGKWRLPPVTVKPHFEFWNYVKLESDSGPEPKVLIDPKISAIFRTKNLLLVGAGVIGVVGIGWYVYRQQRKQFQDNVANAAAACVQDAITQAFQGAIDHAIKDSASQAFPAASVQAFQGAVVQEAIGQALKNAAEDAIGEAGRNVAAALKDVEGALVRALKDETVKDVISEAAKEALTPIRNSYRTTEEVLKARLDAEGLKEIHLATLLDFLSLESSLPKLEGREMELEDFITSSVKELVGYGIPQADAVKLKNGVLYLLDLHYPSFA